MAVAVLLGAGTRVHAHDPGLSTADIRLEPDVVHATIALSPVDLGALVPLDKNLDRVVSPAEFDAARPALLELASTLVRVTVDGQAVAPEPADMEFDPANNNATFRLLFRARPRESMRLQFPQLANLAPGHREFLSVAGNNGAMLAEKLLRAGDDTLEVQVPQDTPPVDARSLSFRSFVLLGIEHILTGYDHLCFLFGILLVCRGLRPVLIIVTCFTIAHSLTLAAATFDVVRISGAIVDPLIAATIVAVGVENLLRDENPRGRAWWVFAFGLIHGFGFATVLRSLGVGANGTSPLLPLFGFNLGVEVGQIAVAAILLPLFWWLRKSAWFVRRGVPLGSTLVALVGGYWFFERVIPQLYHR